MARSGQRRGQVALPSRTGTEPAAAHTPRYTPLSHEARLQLRALQQSASVRSMITTRDGKESFDRIQEAVSHELWHRETPSARLPGMFLRQAAYGVVARSNLDPVDPISLRLAALSLSCLADQTDNAQKRELDVTVAALAFALSGDPEGAGFLLEQHEVDLDTLPLSSRFAIASLVPEMRCQLMSAFSLDSLEFRVLNMMEHDAPVHRISDLHEQIARTTRTFPLTASEIYLLRLATMRVQNHAFRSSHSKQSRSESLPAERRARH